MVRNEMLHCNILH